MISKQHYKANTRHRQGSATQCGVCTTSLGRLIIMDARSAMRPCLLRLVRPCPCLIIRRPKDVCRSFFNIFFMPALVGQTAERIFTKLSHVVDIRCCLRTYYMQINLFLALLKLHGGLKNDEILHIVGPHPYLFSSHARTRQNIAILKKLVHHGRLLYTCANFDELWPTNP